MLLLLLLLLLFWYYDLKVLKVSQHPHPGTQTFSQIPEEIIVIFFNDTVVT